MLRVLSVLLFVVAVSAHDATLPVNPRLGVPGFPDCEQPLEAVLNGTSDVETAAKSLVCAQRKKDFAGQLSIACVGDSITAGVHASSGSTTYPAMLQQKLGDGYKAPRRPSPPPPGAESMPHVLLTAHRVPSQVTNLGACGSTMLKGGDSPFWQRPQYKARAQAFCTHAPPARDATRAVRLFCKSPPPPPPSSHPRIARSARRSLRANGTLWSSCSA